MKNMLKRNLLNGEVTIGTFVQIGHHDITEMLSQLEFDWLLLDGEHGPYGIETMAGMLASMNGSKVVPIIRVPWNDAVFIKRALDIGAYGLVIPLVSSKLEAEKAVRAIYYPPRGIRGVGPRRASRYFLDFHEYVKTVDEELLTIIQIETEEAIIKVEEILSVEGVDGYFLGPMDISATLGHIGEVNHPEVEEVIEKVLAVGTSMNKIGGIYAFNVEDAKRRIKQGFKFVSLGSDSRFLMKAVQDSLEEVKSFKR